VFARAYFTGAFFSDVYFEPVVVTAGPPPTGTPLFIGRRRRRLTAQQIEQRRTGL
jgi:hypothetical protein